MSNTKKKYLDTTVFTYAILYNDEKARRCRRLVKEIALGNVIGITSVITWDEIFFTVKKTLGRDLARVEGKKFLHLPKLQIVDFNNKIVFGAQELVVKYSIDSREAIHVATAIVNGVDEIVSDDGDFDKIEELKRKKL